MSIACHPHHRTTRRVEIGTCYLWDHRKRVAELVDVWEAANRDDLFSVTSLKHYPYVANSDFHKPKHLYSWKTLVRCEKDWEAIAKAAAVERRRRADALSQRVVGGVTPGGRPVAGEERSRLGGGCRHLRSARSSPGTGRPSGVQARIICDPSDTNTGRGRYAGSGRISHR